MKIFYAVAIALVLFVSACAQQPSEQPVPTVNPEQSTQPETQPETGMDKEVPSGEKAMEEGAKEVTTNEVRILGKGGFEPLELTIASGSSVTWVNDDQKTFTLTIFKDGKWYLNSNVMEPGDKFEHQFKEKGTYEHWTLAYGQMGAKIIVE